MKRRTFLYYSLLFIAGCNTATYSPNGDYQNATSELPEQLRLAVADVAGLENLQRYYEPFRVALAEILDEPVEFFPTNTYTAAASALVNNRVEFVLAGPSEYVILKARTNTQPIIGITRPDYYSVICVRADSPIQTVADIKGKTIAMKAIGSTSGHLGPTKLLMDANLNPQSDLEINFLRKEGLPNLLKGEVDAWGGPWRRYLDFLATENLSERDFRILAKSSLLPNDLLMANSNLSPATVEGIKSRLLQHQNQLVQSLTTVEDDKYVGATLIAARDSDYDEVRQVYRAIGQGDFLQDDS
ncbi:MAG: PhnD/SsuA/transferrin family substrate-binding protein [Cyanobacteriota bacterium]|nr:PhnD/SsuA/transferrin family substrate-binding protein [Cyanobacteriota bacterium]